MSYEVLARRFRPQTFDEVQGQRHVVTALRNAIRLGRVPHAILLAGPRGVAKTTLARILARSLNCDEGPTEKPCGHCAPCLEIAAGTSLDVQEIDAASNTGVDNVREIRESVRYAAAPGKHRIFIIDEVHMLSTAAFNALLKTLEEPPARSLFIFATTDPQKIPTTVLSRVQRFDLRRLSSDELLGLLRKICAADSIDAPEQVLRAIVREADGSGRDALTLLDRLTSALGAKLDPVESLAILDVIDRRLLGGVVDAVLAREPARALAALRSALEQGADPVRFAGDLLEEIRNLVVARLLPDPSGLIDAAPDALAEIRARAAGHDPETLQRLFRVLLTRLQELGLATRQEHALEMAVVRLATLPDAESLGALVQKLDALEGGGGPGPGPGAPTPASPSGGTPRPGPRGAAPRASAAPAAPPTPIAASAPAAPMRAAAPEPPAREEPPLPDDADMPTAAGSEPADGRAGPLPALSHEQRAMLEARARAEAKAHPRVQQVIDALDAELREIRVERTADLPRGERA
ncbi:MAG TPA: DNA polymerase III subunit gamma/tau [Myxococcota bacterium]|nr:DNA polymerase III subunit gamma/tau [Myxococcota bacterium]